MSNWSAMGLGHLQPFQPCWVIGKSTAKAPKKSNYKRHPSLATSAYDSAAAMCETDQERKALKQKFIRAWDQKQVLRVNKTTDLGAHGGLSKGQKAPR